MRDGRALARHELPAIDAAAFAAAEAADRLLREADGRGEERWAGYFRRLPDELRDAPLSDLRGSARRARAAFGPKDSVRDAFSPDLTEPLLDTIDRLLKAIARHEAHRP